jgi:putative heme-binding domain-containing protein
MEALRAVISRRPNLSQQSYDLILAQLRDHDNPLARWGATEVLRHCTLSDEQLRNVLDALRDGTLILPTGLLPLLQRSLTETTALAVSDYLMAAIQHGWQPAESELAPLLDHFPDSAQARADAIREKLQQNFAGLRDRLASLEPLLDGGDAERGRQVFFDHRTTCSACHRIHDRGGQVGPDLTRIGTVRAGRDLLEAIVLPSSTFAQGFENYAVTSVDGRIMTGIIARQTPEALIIRDAGGVETRLSRDAIESIERQATSLMPENLPTTMTTEQFRDLLAFVQSLK